MPTLIFPNNISKLYSNCLINSLEHEIGKKIRTKTLNETILEEEKPAILLAQSEEILDHCTNFEHVDAIILESDSLANVVKIIKTVLDGGKYYPQRIVEYGLMKIAHTNHTTTTLNRLQIKKGLTNREIDVLKLVSDGLSNKEIGRKLHISLYTVKNHIHNILEKTKTSNRFLASEAFLTNGQSSTKTIKQQI